MRRDSASISASSDQLGAGAERFKKALAVFAQLLAFLLGRDLRLMRLTVVLVGG